MTLDRIRNTRICNITTACNITPLCIIWLVVAMLLAAPQAAAVTTAEKNTDRLYRHLLNGNLQELKKRGNELIVENPDSSVMYFSAVAARYNDNLPDSDKDVCIGALNNLGYVYFYAFNNPLKAYDHLLRALRLSEETGIKMSLPHLYLNIANVYASLMLKGIGYSSRGRHTEAIEAFRQAEKTINSPLTPERDYFVIGSAIAKAQLLQGNLTGAIGNLKEILGKTDAPDIRGSVYNQLAESYQKLGNTDSANYYSRRYLELSDSVLHKGQLETLRGLNNQYITDRLNAHIEKATRDRHTYMTVMAVGSAVLLVILALGLWAWVSRRRLLKANKLLYEKSRETLLMPESKPEEQQSQSDDSDERNLAGKISEIFSSRDVFSQDFTLERLAFLVGAPVRKVSRCLNDSMGTNFINEVQKSRIREACRLFEDMETSGHLTIEAISDMVGFKSRSNFVHVFKKVTGLTPSQYQKMSRGR